MNVNKWYSLQIHLSITIMASETHFFSYRGWPVTKICLMNIQKNGIQEYWMFQPPKMDLLECFFCLVWSLSTVNSIICSSTVLWINPLFLDFSRLQVFENKLRNIFQASTWKFLQRVCYFIYLLAPMHGDGHSWMTKSSFAKVTIPSTRLNAI